MVGALFLLLGSLRTFLVITPQWTCRPYENVVMQTMACILHDSYPCKDQPYVGVLKAVSICNVLLLMVAMLKGIELYVRTSALMKASERLGTSQVFLLCSPADQ